MSEVKAMNLTGAAHNPLQGGAASTGNNIADRMRANSQIKMQEQMHKYKQRQLERQENDYNIGKKTENFVFSNYPNGKDAKWSSGMDGLKFGEGTRSKHLAKWKEKVGGNMQGFESYFQAGQKADMEGIKKSLIRDPLEFSEAGHKKHISEQIAGWDPAMRESFMNSLDTETRGNLMQYYDPESTLSFGEKVGRVYDDNKKKSIGGALIGAAGVGFTAYRALKGKPTNLNLGGGGGAGASVANKAQKLIGGVKQIGDGSRVVIGKKLTKGKIAQMMESGEISGSQAKILGAGGDIKLGGANLAKMKGVMTDVIPENALKDMPKYLKAARLDGTLTQSSADQLQGVVNSLLKSGKPTSLVNINQGIKNLGTKGGALVKAIESGKVDLGPVKGLGLFKSTALFYGASMVAKPAFGGAASLMGANENNADALGRAGGTATSALATTAAPHVVDKLKKVYAEKGASYIIKKLGKSIGIKAAARIVGKSFLAGLSGPGAGALAPLMLAGEAYMIYDALSDIE